MNEGRPSMPHPAHPQAPRVPQATGSGYQPPHPPPHAAPHPPPHAPARTVVHPPPSPSARPGIAPVPTMRPPTDELEPIELVEDEAEQPASSAPSAVQPPPLSKKIKAMGIETQRAHHDWKRQPVQTGAGACRVRSFHGKYSDQGLEYLDNAINEWLDSHPDIEVKFVTSTVMTFEGKIREPALVLNVWY